MANVAETKLIISAVDRSTAVMQKAQAKFRKMIKVVGSVTAAFYTAQKAWDFAEAAAKFEQSRAAFDSQVQAMGRNATAEFAKIKAASAGLIDDKALVESANRAMSLGIPIEHLGSLMEISRAKARDMGITTQQAFADISTGVGRASPMIIDNLGITLKVGEANEAMAKSLNKTVQELTAQEKKMAILKAVMKSGTEAVTRHNLAQKTTAERMQEITATIENLKLQIGAGIIRVAIGAAAAFQWMAGAALSVVAGLAKIGQGVEWLTDALGITDKTTQRWAGYAEAAFDAAGEKTMKAAELMKMATASSEELMKAYAATGKKAQESADDQNNANNSVVQGLLDNAAWMKVVEAQQREADRKDFEENEALKAYAAGYYRQQDLADKEENLAMQAYAAEYYRQQEIEEERIANKQKLEMAQDYATALTSITESMYLAMGSKSRTVFEIFKALRVAQAIVDMYAAINQVWADPAITSTYAKIAMTAVVAAKTAANVEAIRNAKFGSGSSSFGSVSVSGSPAGGQPYMYYSYEQSQYGSGWRPGEGPERQRGGDTRITIVAMDPKSFRDYCNENPDGIVDALGTDLRRKGKSREMIQRYAMDRR